MDLSQSSELARRLRIVGHFASVAALIAPAFIVLAALSVPSLTRPHPKTMCGSSAERLRSFAVTAREVLEMLSAASWFPRTPDSNRLESVVLHDAASRTGEYEVKRIVIYPFWK